MKIKNNSSVGYILEEDLEYPKNLHHEHNDYLLAPEKITIQNIHIQYTYILTYKKNGCQIIV